MRIVAVVRYCLNKNAELYVAKPIPTLGDYISDTGESVEITPSNIRSINGRSVQYRTVVKNYGNTERHLTLTMRIIGTDDTIKYERSGSFTVPASEIKSLSITSENLSGLKDGDRISGYILDDDTKAVLIDGDTYLNKYGTVTIKYRVGDESRKTDTALPNVSDYVVYPEANSVYTLHPADITGYQYMGKSIAESSVVVGENENIEVTYYYAKDKGKVTLRLTDENNNVVKQTQRYIQKGQAFVPSQSDFPAKAGYKLVLPNSVVFDGVNDIVLTYSYEEGEPEFTGPETPVILPKDIIIEQITQGSTVDLTDNISNLPTGAVVTVLQTVSSDAIGSFVGRVRVTFANGTYREVEIPVIVSAAAPIVPEKPETPSGGGGAAGADTGAGEADEIVDSGVSGGGSGTHSFGDVAENDWYNDGIAYVYERGLMNGTSETSFEPNGIATRAALATIFYRLDGSPEVTGGNNFTDVVSTADTSWYYNAATWAEQIGLMGGYANGAFGPNDPITREQLALILYRYAQYKGDDVTATGSIEGFTDKGRVSDWAQEALQWAIGSGLINGKGNNMLDPQGTATRAEIATVLMRSGA